MKIIQLILCLLLTMPIYTFAYEKGELYEVNELGWEVARTPVADLYVCKQCSSIIEVQISYGQKIEGSDFFKSNTEFIQAMKTPSVAEKFIKIMIKGSAPKIVDSDIVMVKIDPNSLINGNNFLNYSFFIKNKMQYPIFENTYTGIFNGRILRISANYLLGKANEKDLDILERFISSFKPQL